MALERPVNVPPALSPLTPMPEVEKGDHDAQRCRRAVQPFGLLVMVERDRDEIDQRRHNGEKWLPDAQVFTPSVGAGVFTMSRAPTLTACNPREGRSLKGAAAIPASGRASACCTSNNRPCFQGLALYIWLRSRHRTEQHNLFYIAVTAGAS